ncbi:MAG: hypothetical protein M3O30_17620 [Planctomycetota bacterium]|nr:hypothetical protein [Planctomycetota bacterium]
MKIPIVPIGIAVIVLVIAALLLFNRPGPAPVPAPIAKQIEAPSAPASPGPAELSHPRAALAPGDLQAASPSAAPTVAEPGSNPMLMAARKPDMATSAGPDTEPQIPEPLARAALNYVGQDPYAEAIWEAAINDANQPADARQNLIEDLNENGLSDPNNPTVNDLPLIQSRIALIEQIGPSAMDDVNDAAFHEAYKDLVNMEARLTGH